VPTQINRPPLHSQRRLCNRPPSSLALCQKYGHTCVSTGTSTSPHAKMHGSKLSNVRSRLTPSTTGTPSNFECYARCGRYPRRFRLDIQNQITNRDIFQLRPHTATLAGEE
jgi:hypothetical protein